MFWENKDTFLRSAIFCVVLAVSIIQLLFLAPALAESNGSDRVLVNDLENTPQVLIIQSYYPTFDWTHAIDMGILEGFSSGEYSDAELYFEYMDTKRYPEKAYQDSLFDIYRYRYADSKPFDVIIASDNYAIELVCSEEGIDIFGDVPVVFVGANSYDPLWKERRPLLTGVMEMIGPDSTVDLILDLHPETDTILVVSEDNSLTGEIIQGMILDKLEPYEDRVNVELIGDVNEEELIKKLSSLPEGTVVLASSFTRDKDDKVYMIAESSSLIAQSSSVPVYVLWKTHTGYGAVGGKILSGFYEGELAAGMAIKLLDGEDIENIPIIDTPHNRYVFDWVQMDRFSISESDIPEGSVIINKNLSFYEKYRSAIFIFFIVLIIQFALIGLLIVDRKHLRVMESQLIVAKEDAEKSDDLKSHFLANMSHEVRTPMNAILGFSDFLRSSNLKEEKRAHYIELINESGKNLLEIINDILDISKIEAGKLELFNKNISVNELFSDIYDMSSKLVPKEKDITISVKGVEKDVQICVDRVRLEQIFKNLLSNAIKFTEKGVIEFGFACRDNDAIEFYVKDTGIGIPDDLQEFIFGQFQQANYGHAREYQGTGLGLAISKELVELMGGSIWLESHVNVGSTFFFSLPILRDECEGEN